MNYYIKMKNAGHYAKKFLIGMAIGAGVFTAMSFFGGLGVLAFVAPNPLTSFVYATLFFGAINSSGAVMNDLFNPQATPPALDTTAKMVTREPEYSAFVKSTGAQSRTDHVARLQAAQTETAPQR